MHTILIKVEKKEAERPSTATIKEAPALATAPATGAATDNSTAPHKEESATINKSANKETHASAKPVAAKEKSVAAKPTLKKDATTGSRSNSITGQIRQKDIDLNHDFYVIVGKQCRTENAYTGHQYNIFI